MSDVFLNIAGGIKIDDPALDLAIVVSLLSSFDDLPVPEHYAFSAEVGLSGEIRAISRIDQRIAEAEKLGFKKIFISKYNKKSFNEKDLKIEVVMVSKVEELYRILFDASF
jgi:DNA repair protein RadA/Sms